MYIYILCICIYTLHCATATLIWARYAAPAVLVLKYLTSGTRISNLCWTPAGLLLQFYGRVRRHSQKKSLDYYICIFIYILYVYILPCVTSRRIRARTSAPILRACLCVCGHTLTYADVCQAFWTTSGTPLSA